MDKISEKESKLFKALSQVERYDFYITFIDRKNFIPNMCVISKMLNKHFINIVEKSCRNRPSSNDTGIIMTELLKDTRTIQFRLDFQEINVSEV